MLNRDDIVNKILRRLRNILFYYMHKGEFGHLTKKTTIYKPDILDGTGNMFFGMNVYVGHRAWIKCFKSAKILIGDGTYIGRDLHLISLNRVEICDNVLVADRVYISDNIHSYHDICTPIIRQEVELKGRGEVILKTGCWIGENVCIISSVIGKNSVVSANSVVISDVPDFTIVAGNPAKPIKKFDQAQSKWVSVK